MVSGAGTLSFVMQLEARKMVVRLLTPVMDGVGAAPRLIGHMIRGDDERLLADDECSSKGGMPERRAVDISEGEMEFCTTEWRSLGTCLTAW
ncbi:unnamed protein product [Heligmosomoides polygyrus]|uniref:Uncharacterized protein n=1 Tax=Heligmosomoides polygyrus TaxID=6339 RepID=A0A183G052_HELPZ|nr:unnamed protein product [Heligmosomoides polygyrus]